mmetsp:Transcript_2375/g.4000  ORF Transcript_2375/g.4000 Transcript_2375/m.4000 type:complete len:283 (-) Transcript_2375:778-1626(-)
MVMILTLALETRRRRVCSERQSSLVSKRSAFTVRSRMRCAMALEAFPFCSRSGFPCRLTTVALQGLAKASHGTAPEKLLWPKYKWRKLTRFPSSGGKTPVSELPPKCKRSKLVSLPTQAGRGPSSLLERRLREVRLLPSSHSPFGRRPVKAFSWRNSPFRRFSLLSPSGSLPSKSFPASINVSRLASPPTASGKGPHSALWPSQSSRKFAQDHKVAGSGWHKRLVCRLKCHKVFWKFPGLNRLAGTAPNKLLEASVKPRRQGSAPRSAPGMGPVSWFSNKST